MFWNHQASLSLPLCEKLEGLWGYWTMILSASSWNYSFASCHMWIFSSTSCRTGPSTQSLSGQSCSSSNIFSDFSVHYYIPAVAGNWQQPSACEGPLITACSFIFFFFVLNDHIFHCLNMPQNSPNLEYKSHLPTLFIIYCLPKFPPLGGAVIKESAFWLITPIYFVAHSKTLYPRIQWIVLNLVV